MAAYVFVNVEVTDPERYKDYIRVAPHSIAEHGGRYVARGGRTERLEGTWDPKRVVILEFPTFEKAKEWWGCDAYRGPKGLRQSASITNMILVEGLGPGGIGG